MSSDGVSERARRWAATMSGYTSAHGEVVVAHADSSAKVGGPAPAARANEGPLASREAQLEHLLAPGATRSSGAGHRAKEEEPDEFRTCFERDRDRILHSTAFRRLAGKTQVFIFPDDHMRTRLTHALEVAQIATGIARPLGLNVSLTEAIALGHDCGHGPGGHASEEALDPFVPGGFDHATWGADVTLASLNLCEETLDGIRNHSWSRPAPATPEGEVVSWADRIAYVCHDFEDAVAAGIVTSEELPAVVRERCGLVRREQLGSFITAMIHTTSEYGVVAMDAAHAEALASFRAFNYDTIYLRDASRQQASSVVVMLRALVETFSAKPHLIPELALQTEPVERDSLELAVGYVAGMTDRFACRSAVNLLGWSEDQLPSGIDR